jgi:hypothetical protein
MLGVQENDRAVALAIQLFSQLENVLWTGVAAEFASFATLNINDNSSFGHRSKPPFL